MSKRTKELLSKVSGAVLDEEGAENRVQRSKPILAQRETALNRIATGKQRNVTLLRHPPSRIRMWAEHNRRYDLLSVARCQDLIEGFQRTGQQEFPAIVRPVDDSDQYDYEVICGARRHWTAAYLEWDLLIEVRPLTDKQAFILQDLENRDREDISDYERAVDYLRALPKFFDNNQAQMARHLQVDKSNFGSLLDLARMPKAIVESYRDLRDLKVHHSRRYKALMADDDVKRRLLKKARAIKEEQMSGPQVFKTLRNAASAPNPRPRITQYGKLVAQSQAAGTLKVSVPAKSAEQDTEAFAQELRRDFDKMLKAWLKETGDSARRAG